MRNSLRRNSPFGVIVILLVCFCATNKIVAQNNRLAWQKLENVSATNGGISKGVSAVFAAMCSGNLLMAGGANFPDLPVAEGGKKMYYDDILLYVEKKGNSQWAKIGQLPTPTAYGVTFLSPKGIIFAGGMNNDQWLNTVYRIKLNSGKVVFNYLPPLPESIDNASGVCIGHTLYIVGGNVSGKPSSRMYVLDLNRQKDGWVLKQEFPGGKRIQPTVVKQKIKGEDCLFLTGGFCAASEKEDAVIYTDAYYYSPKLDQWTKLADVDNGIEKVSLGGGVGVSLNDSILLCMGGVNKDIFFVALQREKALKEALAKNNQALANTLKEETKAYFNRPPEWFQFNNRLCYYHVKTNTWSFVPDNQQSALAGSVLVTAKKTFYLLNGEIKPGVRTPNSWKVKYH